MNAVSWFEIPVADMDRAVKFYSTVLDIKMEINQMGPLLMAWFPSEHGKPGANGSLVKHEEAYVPSNHGALLYFSCEEVQTCLDRVESVGGTVLVNKKLIAEDVGYMGLALDSEGNRIAFHSNQ